MEVPNWASMDQKQRIMTIGAGVVGLLAVVLIARALLGGESIEEPPPAVLDAYDQAIKSGAIQEAPPVEEEVVREPGSGKRMEMLPGG